MVERYCGCAPECGFIRAAEALLNTGSASRDNANKQIEIQGMTFVAEHTVNNQPTSNHSTNYQKKLPKSLPTTLPTSLSTNLPTSTSLLTTLPTNQPTDHSTKKRLEKDLLSFTVAELKALLNLK